MTFLCPNDGSARLYSSEETTIDYPIVVKLSTSGDREPDYTGEDRFVNDEGTQFRDKVWCRDCLWEGKLSELVTARYYAHTNEPIADVMGVDEDSDAGADIRFQAVCRAAHIEDGARYECTWCSTWFHADAFVEEAQQYNDRADANGTTYTDPGQLAYNTAAILGNQHLYEEGVKDALG